MSWRTSVRWLCGGNIFYPTLSYSISSPVIHPNLRTESLPQYRQRHVSPLGQIVYFSLNVCLSFHLAPDVFSWFSVSRLFSSAFLVNAFLRCLTRRHPRPVAHPVKA